ncbi:MAG: heme NO-binding domain-containing protein [Thermodesulfobacteriota bacterium]
MKGIIFNLLERFIVENLGEEKYEEILSHCTLKTKEPFVGPGSYPDEDLMAIVARAVETMGITLPEALRAFGRFCLPKFAERFPEFMTPYDHPKEFLMTVDSVIHVEVEKLYPDAQTPSLVYEDPAPDRLVIRYESRRKLCHLFEGLIDGVADYYGSPIEYGQRTCMLEGARACEFELAFPSEGEASR